MLGPLDMFGIGIGPSSSHTIGPMKAALTFVRHLESHDILTNVVRLELHLFGSLALTGEGHGTIFALLNGLSGEDPRQVDPDTFRNRSDTIKSDQKISLLNKHTIEFIFDRDIELHMQEFLPQHSNGMRFVAIGKTGEILFTREYFSIGGGFILDEDEIKHRGEEDVSETYVLPYLFKNASELFALCKQHNLTVAQLVAKNELVRKTADELRAEALNIINVMHISVERGISIMGTLPGGLNVRRRAPGLYEKLNTADINNSVANQRLLAMAFAMGVNEENAAFGRVVTAPTNGSAGTIPGVLEYYRRFCQDATIDKMIDFILTAGAIGMLYKMGASISAAEVGCQGEIGVSCSMAAGALTAALGGSLIQVEQAAEIAMEHSLGMTCDPIAGLVQIPCIERNGVAASRAIDIAGLALLEEEPGIISLDEVIKTMLQTGKDMAMHYKETSLGGLAVNIVNC